MLVACWREQKKVDASYIDSESARGCRSDLSHGQNVLITQRLCPMKCNVFGIIQGLN